ncbi:MAG: hypothetical protein JSU95_14080 [Betaproteobacteria bacterium]|nr:MAG: hypothetical protein JSU95_14080 [Betaproteobacteria bacterium]
MPVFDITSQCADGYHDGKVCRQDGTELPWDMRAATDEYARGFLAGYYMQT